MRNSRLCLDMNVHIMSASAVLPFSGLFMYVRTRPAKMTYRDIVHGFIVVRWADTFFPLVNYDTMFFYDFVKSFSLNTNKFVKISH